MQHRNYTYDQNNWTYPRTPGGGGFSTTVFSLSYLYELYILRRNIWTTSNTNFDLVRYTGSKFTFFRHPWWDFIVIYTLMYPMSLNFNDYMETHPLRMLLHQKKITILSLKHKPSGKLYVTRKFKPPKQMVNKWFFQDMFAPKPLILLRACVCDLFQPYLGQSGGNELVTLTCINIHDFYDVGNWGTVQTNGYSPIPTQHPTTVKIKTGSAESTVNIGTSHNSTGYLDGWFQKKILTATQATRSPSLTDFKYPTYKARYNPTIDTGAGNLVYLCSIHTERYDKPTHDKVLWAQNQPLWLLLFGFQDYVAKMKGSAETFPIYYLLITSEFIHPTSGNKYPKTHLIIDDSFVKGLGPFQSTIQDQWLNNWYPTLTFQQESISNIVKTGPFIPKPDPTKGNWELHYKSTFYFKWGGALQQDNQIYNPADKKDYDVPDKQLSPIQISDPQSQIPETILHSWDFRRGYITPKALKRMSDHLKVESIISTDTEVTTPTKKPRLSKGMPALQEEETQEQTYLHSLFEKSISQEETQEETSIKQLIKQQHKQQQGIKLKLLQLITHMKREQQQLQLHAGLPQ